MSKILEFRWPIQDQNPYSLGRFKQLAQNENELSHIRSKGIFERPKH